MPMKFGKMLEMYKKGKIGDFEGENRHLLTQCPKNALLLLFKYNMDDEKNSKPICYLAIGGYFR